MVNPYFSEKLELKRILLHDVRIWVVSYLPCLMQLSKERILGDIKYFTHVFFLYFLYFKNTWKVHEEN